MLRCSLKPSDVLLVGRLSFDRRPFFRSQSPALFLDVWCPHCNRRHNHGWDEASRRNAVTHRQAHCGDQGYESYFIGLDPSIHAENRRTLAGFLDYLQAYRRWRDGQHAPRAMAS